MKVLFSRAFGPRTSVQMGFISGLRPSNVRSDGFVLGPSALRRPLRWVSSRAFGPQTSAQMGFFSGLRPSNVRSDGFHLGPSALKRPFRWVSSRAFGPQTSVKMGFISGLRPSNVRSDGFHLGHSPLKRPLRWVSSRAFGPQMSAQMGFISGLRPLNVRSDGFHLGPSALKRPLDGFHLGPSALERPFRWVSSRAFGPQTSAQMGFISGLRPSIVLSAWVSSRAFGPQTTAFGLSASKRTGCWCSTTPPKLQTPATWSRLTRIFWKKYFYTQLVKGFRLIYNMTPSFVFWFKSFLTSKPWADFSQKFRKNHNVF